MRKLLVPVDGSDCSLRAVALAAARARESSGCALHVLVVHSPIDVHGEIQVYVGEPKMREFVAERNQWILGHAVEQLRDSGVSYSTEAAEGDVAHTIAQRADELGCEAIIMGTRGSGRIANLVMGSTAMKVVHLTSLPVTLVK
jgi:nucleotide-binding universal stress UspA family protein